MMKQELLAWSRRVAPLGLLALVAGAAIYAGAPATGYKVIRRIPIGGEGGWDYLRVDPDAKRIYVLRGSHMMVVDEVSGKVIGDVPAENTKNMHGVALATDLGKGFTSNG
ncbi:MAG: hypothetical protein LAO19_12475 [Acidobacteriia bacterium]|nr:hypothetical protein [Terriglobia bacterium]